MQERSEPAVAKLGPATIIPDALTILVAEDDTAVRELAARFLEIAGFRVLAARDGVEALQFATEYGSSISVLLTDVVMPRMRGPELAHRLSNLLPGLKVILTSGYLEHIEQSHKLMADHIFLEKPFTCEILLHKVNEARRSDSLADLKR